MSLVRPMKSSIVTLCSPFLRPSMSLGNVFLTSAAQRRGHSTWKNSRTLKPSRIRFRISCSQPTTRVGRPEQLTEGGPIMETAHHLGDLLPDAGAWVFAQAGADPHTSTSPGR